ncbi:hypothetical protein [Streptomonospora nanhaiensis]|uniref:hypothetical protein n=1 Tax=Streptomonospora nanhaiensis TaxID=1323731 RepID=UPI001C383DD0|nr:hypothetical protein [Streptomonospora nanhaiensis]
MSLDANSSTKKISPAAYLALTDALSAIHWYERTFARFINFHFRDHQEVIAGLYLREDSKRHNSEIVVDRLAAREHVYQSLTLSLMVHISSMESFPELERHENPKWLIQAKECVGVLAAHTSQYRRIIEEREIYAQELARQSALANEKRTRLRTLEDLKDRFLKMEKHEDAQMRGREFESFINEWFALCDLYPHAAYSLDREQIDGSFSFDTDDYILEAKWQKRPISRADLDIFSMKVPRKGKMPLACS